MKTVAIIGASGELGSRLVNQLSGSYSLKCVVRNLDKRDFSGFKNAEVIEVSDIGETDALAKALDGCSAIISATYISFAKVISEALTKVESKPEHVLFTGSTGIYTQYPSQSAQDKRDAEAFIKEQFPIPWTILRPTMIYGHAHDRNISKLAKTLNRSRIMPLIGSGNNLIQPVYIFDLVNLFEMALLDPKHYGKDYDVGALRPLTNKELFKTIARHLGKRVRFISIPPQLVSMALRVLSVVGIRPISQEQVLRFQEDKNVDIQPLVDAFGVEPMLFEDGSKRLISLMKQDGLV